MTASPHHLVNPLTLARPVGFTHAVVPTDGRTVYLGGQTAQRPDGEIAGEGIAEQFDLALGNVTEALRHAGGAPEHLVSVLVYTTNLDGYRAHLRELGATYRRHLGRHYPAMALFGVTGLLDPRALVELVCVAVVPEE